MVCTDSVVSLDGEMESGWRALAFYIELQLLALTR